MSDRAVGPPEPIPVHPCDIAWNRLVAINEVLTAASAASSPTVYRTTLLSCLWRAKDYENRLEQLLAELGE